MTLPTAITRLAEADGHTSKICSITGHSEISPHSIMKHYLALTGELTDNAIAELVAHEEQKKAQEETKEAPKLDSSTSVPAKPLK